MNHSLLHPRDNIILPLTFLTLARQKGFELVIRPHVVCWDPSMAQLGGPQVLLDGVIAQVDRAERMGEKREQEWTEELEELSETK